MNKLQRALPDLRYTVQLECCGHEKPMFVARFCDTWIDCANTEEGAIKIAHSHRRLFLLSVDGLAICDLDQQSKAAWLQSSVEAGEIKTQGELLEISTRIGASGKVFGMVQDHFGASLPRECAL